MSLDQILQSRLQARLQSNRYRRRQIVASPSAASVTTAQGPMLCFCSNDYLGLADHPAVKQAMAQALDHFGAGSGAAHLVSGHTTEHHALEEELADFTGRPRALLFSTGYMANLGVISALSDRHDTIFEDRLNHASLLDAARLSDAGLKRYRHTDLAHLEQLLQRSETGNRWIVTDGVFSMDGDVAPLAQLAQVARAHEAWLLVDDAHGLGVLGAHGGGALESAQLTAREVPLLVGTLGKAFGSFGAFVAGDHDLIEFIMQRARSYLFTTALPPAVAAATRAALRIARTEDWRRTHLQALVARFRDGAAARGLPLLPSVTPIQPVSVPGATACLAASAALMQRGFWVAAIRHPTVPAGTERLRVTLSAAHALSQVDALLDALAEVLPRDAVVSA